jgi:hypothetical protein
MSLPVISVIIPTIDGREDHLERCVNSYQKNAAGAYELDLIIEQNHSSCGLGWQAGIPRVKGEFIHLTCDDIEAKPGWASPAVEAVLKGFCPAPQVVDASGYPQSCPVVGQFAPDWTPVAMTSLPFFSRAQAEKILPLFTAHYYTDNWVGWRAERAGWPVVLRSEYAFTHYYAQHKRGAGMSEGERMANDLQRYLQAQQMEENGEWTAPWPPEGR